MGGKERKTLGRGYFSKKRLFWRKRICRTERKEGIKMATKSPHPLFHSVFFPTQLWDPSFGCDLSRWQQQVFELRKLPGERETQQDMYV